VALWPIVCLTLKEVGYGLGGEVGGGGVWRGWLDSPWNPPKTIWDPTRGQAHISRAPQHAPQLLHLKCHLQKMGGEGGCILGPTSGDVINFLHGFL